MRGKGQKRRGEGGGDARAKRGYWADPSKVTSIPLGTRGILVSCVMGKERHAGREAISIVTEAYDALNAHNEDKAADQPDSGSGGAEDISAAIANEVADLKDEKNQKFVVNSLGVPCLLYLQFNTEVGTPTPSEVVLRMCRHAKETGQNNTRLCTRFYPIEYTCACTMEAMEKLAEEMAANHFAAKEGEEGTDFSVELDKRASDPKLERMEIINAFAKAIPAPPNKVNLSNPSKSIMINLIKGTCGAAVVEDFRALNKYNIKQIANPESEGKAKEKGAVEEAKEEETKPEEDSKE